MVLLRQKIGGSLRDRRLAQGRTLRQVSQDAKVSLGYLSEIERGQKEASSELLASICDALDMRLSELLMQVAPTIALEERYEVVGSDGPSSAPTPASV
jgi:transcriptional regulator with XRE-family HTH domain